MIREFHPLSRVTVTTLRRKPYSLQARHWQSTRETIWLVLLLFLAMAAGARAESEVASDLQEAYPVRIVDADTLWVMWKSPYSTHGMIQIRLLDVYAPERHESAGPAATALHASLYDLGKRVYFRDSGGRTFGRIVADVYVDSRDLPAGHPMKPAGDYKLIWVNEVLRDAGMTNQGRGTK